MAPFGVKLWENAFQTFPDISFFDAPKNFSAIVFKKNSFFFFFQESGVLEELWFFGRDGQMRLDKWPPKFWLSALYDFSQRGKSGTYRFWSGFWTENDFNHLVLWCYDVMIMRYDDTIKFTVDFFFQESGFLEELWFFRRNRQMRLEKWHSKFWFAILYDFWQRGTSGRYDFSVDFWRNLTFVNKP